MVLLTFPAPAADYGWTNLIGGAFETSGNWSPPGPPASAADHALFTNPATYTVSFAAGHTNGVLAVRAGTVTFSMGGQTYAVDDFELAVDDNAMASGALNGGTLNVAPTGADLVMAAGSASVGTLILENGATLAAGDNFQMNGEGGVGGVGENILGEGIGGLGQLSEAMTVDGEGNIYFSSNGFLPSHLVRFNIALADYEIPPADIRVLLDEYLPTQDDILGGGGSNPIGRWQAYRKVIAMNFSSPPRLIYTPVINTLNGGVYDWSGVFSLPVTGWDDAQAFRNAFRFHVGSWPSAAYPLYDTLPVVGDTTHRINRFDARGHAVRFESYPGAVGGPWRLDIGADGSVLLFDSQENDPNLFDDFWNKPYATRPFNALNYIDWWDYGLLTMSRRDLGTAMTGIDDPMAQGEIEIRYDAIAHMLTDTGRFARVLENIAGPALAPAFMTSPLAGEADRLLGVGEHGYYLARFDMSTIVSGYVDKVYLKQDTGDPAVDLPLGLRLGPYAHAWTTVGNETWLYVGGYTGLARTKYAVSGVPLAHHTVETVDGGLSTVNGDAAGPGPIKRYRYLRTGLDDRIFLTGTSTPGRGGTAYSGGLFSFHQTQLDTLWKLSHMSRCYHTRRLRTRIVRRPDGTPVQEFCLAGGTFDAQYAAGLPSGDVPANQDPKVFRYRFAPGGPMQDLYGFSLAPDNGEVVLSGQAHSGNRRYLVLLQGNHVLTFDLHQDRFIDGKTIGYGPQTTIAEFTRPHLRLIRAPDDRLYAYVASDPGGTWANFVEIMVSDAGLLSFGAHLRLSAASAAVLGETLDTTHAFLPDRANGDGSYDLFLGMPLDAPGTHCRVIEDFVPPRRFEPARTLNVLSAPVGAVQVSGDRPGQTPYSATTSDDEIVTLTAAATAGNRHFLRWEDGDGTHLGSDLALVLTMASDQVVFAVYDAGFVVTGIAVDGTAGEMVITWQSATSQTYQVLRGTNLVDGGFAPIGTGIVATGDVSAYTDDVNTVDRAFYRVEQTD